MFIVIEKTITGYNQPSFKFSKGAIPNSLDDAKDLRNFLREFCNRFGSESEYSEFSTNPEKSKPETPKNTKSERKGSVYVMANRRNGYFKIGFSKHPKFREETLQSQEPEIELVAMRAGTMADEEDLHGIHAVNRLRGEWFAIDEDAVIEMTRDWDVPMKAFSATP